MTSGFTTWEQLGPADGDVLLAINSPQDRDTEVASAYRELDRWAGKALYIIADPAWRPWMTARGVGADRVLYACDAQGDPIELNHFLESSAANRWAMSKQFRFIAGTAPHSLYNEEVKSVFEQRVGLLLRDGRFLAHALPERGVYCFDLAGLLHRLGRESKQLTYQAACHRLIDGLYQGWRQRGSPALAADADRADALRRLFSHLDPAIAGFDEQRAIPASRDDLTECVGHLHAVIRDREEALAERSEAVVIRDRIIADLRLELETPMRRMRRWWSRK